MRGFRSRNFSAYENAIFFPFGKVFGDSLLRGHSYDDVPWEKNRRFGETTTSSLSSRQRGSRLVADLFSMAFRVSRLSIY